MSVIHGRPVRSLATNREPASVGNAVPHKRGVLLFEFDPGAPGRSNSADAMYRSVGGEIGLGRVRLRAAAKQAVRKVGRSTIVKLRRLLPSGETRRSPRAGAGAVAAPHRPAQR